MEIDRIIRGFTNHMDVANAPVTFYSTLSVPSRTGKTAIYMTLTIVCDTLFVRLMPPNGLNIHSAIARRYIEYL